MGRAKRQIFSILLALVLVLSFSLVMAVPASAAVINVPADYGTIQEAIDNANAGDTVLVAPGTYYEHITLKDGVEVQGAGAGISIIDGTNSGTVVTADGVGPTTVLDGFTITHGDGGNGGGMYNTNSSPTVSNCTFSHNVAGVGGGMFNNNSSPTLTNCDFPDNTASLGGGGGMCNYDSSSTLTNCTFNGNEATTHGGGMWNQGYPSPTLSNCTFFNNEAGQFGGGMFNYDSSPILTNCAFFYYNRAVQFGGGMYNNNSSPILTNCTFTGNWDMAGGGGVYNNDSSPTVTNCILWGDSSPEIFNAGSSAPAVICCDVQGGYSGGEDNIDADPLFTNPAHADFRLQAGSPCIDVGNNDAPFLPSTDFEGDPRIWPVDGVVDMGIDERVPPTEVWVDDGFDDSTYGWGYDHFANIQDGIDAVSGSTVYVAPGTYFGGIQIEEALTLVSTGGAAVTIIQGVDSNDCYLVRIHHSDVTFQGFTVTNPDYSGGCDASGILVGDYGGYGLVSNVQILDNIVTQVRSDAGTPSNYGATGINIGRGPISDVVISGNTITDIDNPDGAAIDHTCGINIWDNADNVLISGNIISDIKYNGILLQYVTNIQLVNNLIANCQTGLRLEPYTGAAVTNATVTNCTFSANSGDGMYNYDSSPTVTNCILWGNGVGINDAGTSAPVVTYCDVQGGYAGTGNIDTDPIFVGGGDYHLQPGSPCVDTGSNGAPSLPGTDFEGDSRIIDGNGDAVAVVDMGADEYLPPPSPPVIILHPTDQNIMYGLDATFTAAASGMPTPTVQWQVDNGGGWADIPGATSTTLIVATPPVSYSGYQYRAVFTNSEGEAISNAATLTVAGVGGGGGGGTAPPTTISEVGSVNLLPYLDWQGRARIKIILRSDDNVYTVILFSDTLVSNVQGNPLESMEIVTLSTPPPPPGYVLVGLAYDCLPDGAHFSPNVTMIFAYDEANIPGGVSEQDLVLAYWDGNKWVNLLTAIDAAANTATTESGHFTPFTLLAYTGLADFTTSDLSITPAMVDIGQEVTITLSVANIGDTEGSYSVVLKINGVEETEQRLTLTADSSQSVSFSVTRKKAGSYSVDVNGLTGSFTVVAPAAPQKAPPEEAPPEAPAPIAWWIWVIAGAVVVGLIIFFLVRRRAY